MTDSKNTENVEKTKKINIKYLILALIILLICGGILFLLCKDNYVPKYRDIVRYSMSAKLWDKDGTGEKNLVYFDFNVSAVDDNLFNFNFVTYDYDDSVIDSYSGILRNKDMIEITDKIDSLDLSSVEGRADNTGGYEFLTVFGTRIIEENPVESSMVCYDDIDESVRTQINNFYSYIKDYIESDVESYKD